MIYVIIHYLFNYYMANTHNEIHGIFDFFIEFHLKQSKKVIC